MPVTCCTSVVGSSNRPECVLSGSVPNLALNIFIVDADHSGSELDSNCYLVFLLESNLQIPNLLSMNYKSKQDFPTPVSPIIINLNKYE